MAQAEGVDQDKYSTIHPKSLSQKSLLFQFSENTQPLVRLAVASICLFFISCESSDPPVAEDPMHSEEPPLHVPWPEADAMFQSTANFLGGDSAYSADLGAGRVLWLFGDTFVGQDRSTREGSDLVRNSIIIQQGYDPSSAAFELYIGDRDGSADAFISPTEPNWFWPGPAVVVGTQLLLTFYEVQKVTTGLGFEVFASAAFMVSNPEAPPSDWAMTELDIPALPTGVRFGLGALWLDDDYLYAFMPLEPGNKDIYLARWDSGNVASGDLSAPQFFAGDSAWSKEPSESVVIVERAQTEFSVHLDANSNRFIMVSVDGFGGSNIVRRVAERPEGPWSQASVLTRPSESDRGAGSLVYSAKAHPFLTGGESVITYSSNDLDFNTLLTDMSIYFPRLQRLQSEM